MTSDYGTYRLIYSPPSDQITPGVEMTLSGEADVSQILSCFEGFLKASGYVIDGELQIVAPRTNKEWDSFGCTYYDDVLTLSK